MGVMVHAAPPRRRDLHERIRKWRGALGISQNEFARRAGVYPSILSRVLADKVTSGPCETKVRRYIAKLERRVGAA